MTPDVGAHNSRSSHGHTTPYEITPQPGPTLMSLLSTYREATPLQACSKTPPCAKVCGFRHGRDIGPGLKKLRSGSLITLPPF